jgi:ceramide glucosyltransferase
VFWYWLFAGPALLLAFFSLRGERKRAAYVASRLAEPDSVLPPVSLIVPVKGYDEGLRENLAALASQDYPNYELLVAARTAEDIPGGVLPRRVKVVLSAAKESDTGEKVQNLNAAVRAVRKSSQIFVFADSDGRPSPRWLRELVRPLPEDGVGASTGYRWFTPVPPTFWSLMRSVWDAVSFGLLGPGDSPFAWGGATAIYKETFYAVRVPDYWQNTISDDYARSAAIHDAGLKIAWAPGALTPCMDHTTAFAFFGWMRRQMTITRVYNPRLWWLALVAHVFYCGGMAASIVASVKGYRLAEWALIAQLSPGMLKGVNRATLAKASLPDLEAWFKRHSWVHAIWIPLATWIWLVSLLSSTLGNTVNWRGRRYRIQRQGKV